MGAVIKHYLITGHRIPGHYTLQEGSRSPLKQLLVGGN